MAVALDSAAVAALILAAADIHPEIDSLFTGDTDLAAVAGVDCRIDLLG